MPSIGSGVVEIRVHTELEHRVIYVATIADVIHVTSRAASRRRAA